MIVFKSRLLVATAIVVVSAAAAEAKAKAAPSQHKFSGGVKFTYAADSNIGGAPAKPGGGAETGDGDDEEDFDIDDLGDEDALDDILEEIDVDTEDLTLDDAADDDDPEPVVAGKGAKDGDERVQSDFALKHDYTSADITGLKWKSAATIGLNHQNDRHDLNRRGWAVNTGPEFEFKSIGVKVNPSITYLDLDVNSKDQMTSTVASLKSSWKVTKNFALDATYNHEFRNNLKTGTPELEVDGFKVGGKYVYGKNLFSAAVSPKFERNDKRIKNKDKMGYEVGYGRKLPYKLEAALGMKYGTVDSVNAAAPGRVDDDYQYTLKLSKKFAQGFYADLGAIYKQKDSDLNAKDKTNSTVFVSTGWKF